MLAMLLNVFVPHITVSLMQRRLMPGTLTALFFILPITLTGLINGLRSVWLEPHPLALYGIGVTAALLASIPLLFRLGAALCRETPKG